ncbi:MAG: NAD(P)H-hydrate dehydratase [bacterium]
MRKLVTNAEMAEVDRRSIEDYEIPPIVLMENAGQNAYRILVDRIKGGEEDGRDCGHGGAAGIRCSGAAGSVPASPEVEHVVFVAGGGNNGGDAMVMARACHQEGLHAVTVVLARETAKGNAQVNLAILRKLGVRIVNAFAEEGISAEARAAIEEADWIVDGVSGTGISGSLRAPLSDLVEAMNAAPGRICAVDVPSGISDTYAAWAVATEADLTLTMGTPKQCLYLPAARAKAGEIVTIPVSFPRELLTDPALTVDLAESADLTHLIPPLRRDAYKTRRGVVAVFGGSVGKTGASLLAAEGAGRSSAGMVHLYVAEDVYGTVAAGAASIMVHPAGPDAAADAAGADAFVCGPGWGVGSSQVAALRALAGSGIPGVIDADGLNSAAAMLSEGSPGEFDGGGRTVMTPHPGEFSRLADAFGIDTEDILAALRSVARTSNSVICYKSHVLFIAAPDGRIRVVDGMRPEVATAGAGDILAGITGGLLARGMDAFDAATAAVLIHQEAGRRTAEEVGWFAAEDLLPRVSRVVGDFTETVYT